MGTNFINRLYLYQLALSTRINACHHGQTFYLVQTCIICQSLRHLRQHGVPMPRRAASHRVARRHCAAPS